MGVKDFFDKNLKGCYSLLGVYGPTGSFSEAFNNIIFPNVSMGREGGQEERRLVTAVELKVFEGWG